MRVDEDADELAEDDHLLARGEPPGGLDDRGDLGPRRRRRVVVAFGLLHSVLSLLHRVIERAGQGVIVLALVGAGRRLEQLANENADLHKSCDFTLKNFDVRQEAMSQEIEALNQAKAVLSGADFS